MRTDDGWADHRPRRPGEVPDLAADVTAGVDTDDDGRPDTVLAAEGPHLAVHTDLDGDGLADQVLLIGPDGSAMVTAADPGPKPTPDPDLLGGLAGEAHSPITYS